MKSFLALCGILAFIGSATLNAHENKSVKDQKVYCCHDKNNCDKLHTKSECEKEGGKVVNSCRECK